MKKDELNFQNLITSYVDQVKELLSPEIWQNVLLNCSKNEMFVMWFLYRNSDVNMTQIAEYIHVPLNTATGIISRMEKRNLVTRIHSEKDKRVVTISLSDKGNELLQSIMKQVMFYVTRVYKILTPQESQTLFDIMDKIAKVLGEKPYNKKETKKIRKITIE